MILEPPGWILESPGLIFEVSERFLWPFFKAIKAVSMFMNFLASNAVRHSFLRIHTSNAGLFPKPTQNGEAAVAPPEGLHGIDISRRPVVHMGSTRFQK